MPDVPADLPRTLGALRASGHELRTVKEELRENLVSALRAGEDPFPGVVGIEDTVRPQLERALLAGHDLVLLGERGQGKTRLLRTIVGLLDEWTPVIEGSELHEHPYEPVTVWARRTVAEHGDSTPVAWRHRSERYGEKLATPDTSVGDLIGDVDPVKVAEGRTLGDPETVHYGLVPRTNRGIFAINELPDLAERIQVSLLNVLEERDIQVRGYALRLPLDLLLVASANPEDYTNRGRIITPLKDRFGAEIRTHYPLRLSDEVALVRQEAELRALVPQPPARGRRAVHPARARVAGSRRALRASPRGSRSPRPSRSPPAHCAARRSPARRAAVARVGDLPGRRADAARQGRVRGERGGPRGGGARSTCMRRAVAETFRAHLGGVDLSALITRFDEGSSVEVGDLVTSDEVLRRVGPLEGLGRIVVRARGRRRRRRSRPGIVAACLETALEGLYLTRRISKDEVPGGGRAVYGGA